MTNNDLTKKKADLIFQSHINDFHLSVHPPTNSVTKYQCISHEFEEFLRNLHCHMLLKSCFPI
jgi:hypothetical protein